MDVSKIRIRAKRRILKYEEGVDPNTGEPSEIVEKEDEFVGEEAITLLNQLGVIKGGA